eukprot:scaffold360107_cov49-Prasinocladus_malaysianus.AAC.1
MTVSQSKGLEFDDVFLVDFFQDSPADAEWRLLQTYLEEVNDQAMLPLAASHPSPDLIWRFTATSCDE